MSHTQEPDFNRASVVEEPPKPEKRHPGKAEISCFSNLKAKQPSNTTSVLRFALDVRYGKFSKKIKTLRQFLEEGKDEDVKRLKDSLPAVSLSGTVVEGLRKDAFIEGRFQHSGYLQGDFDTKDFHPRSAVEIRDSLARDEHVQAAFLSPRNGVKAIIYVGICHTPEEHLAAFIAAASYFQEKYGLKFDPSTKDPARLFLVSHDPDAYVRLQPAIALPFASAEKSGNGSKSQAHGAASGYDRQGGTTPKHRKLTTEEIRSMLACIPPRPDYDTWLKIGSAVWDATGDEATGTMLLKEWSPEEEHGEYAEKYKSRLRKVTAGTLVHLARENGYQNASVGDEGNEEDEVHIPDDVFPVPAGKIEYRRAGGVIFGTIAPSHSMFMRSGTIHEIEDDGNEPAHFVPLSPERFCSVIENYEHRVARREWQEAKDGDAKGKFIWRSCRFPLSAAKVLLCSDAAKEQLPHVSQLAACAILTKEGTVIGHGYHAHAGGTYITGGESPPDMPVEAAVTAILGLMDDFNFVTPADKARAVASIFSPALKMGGWIDDDFPLDVAEADQSQSGKTYRQKLVNRIYNETPSAITAPKGGVGSLDESISTALIKGRPFIMLDNFRGKLDSTILEQAIRGESRVTCRALKVSADVNTRPFNWQLSTNGAEFTRDIANRSIITRIRKQPPGYRFKEYAEGSLVAHVAARQPFYLGAVFSIIAEWSRHGCPKTDETRHDFRGWCQALDWIVRNIFKLAPLLDGHREEQVRTANPALQWLRDVAFASRASKQMHVALTTAQLVSVAEDAGIEFPGNSLSREEPHQRAGKILGKLFRESEGKAVVVDGITVTRDEREVHVAGRGYEMQKLYTFTQNAEG